MSGKKKTLLALVLAAIAAVALYVFGPSGSASAAPFSFDKAQAHSQQ